MSHINIIFALLLDLSSLLRHNFDKNSTSLKKLKFLTNPRKIVMLILFFSNSIISDYKNHTLLLTRSVSYITKKSVVPAKPARKISVSIMQFSRINSVILIWHSYINDGVIIDLSWVMIVRLKECY